MNLPMVKSVWGRAGAVASGHPLATLHAVDCMRMGGSLVDAMLAASAILTVALPHTSSLGGCGMLLYYEAGSGEVHALNGTGRAPLAAHPGEFSNGMPRRGVRAAVVPSLVRMWARAHERFGRLSLGDVLRPAIHLAEGGVAFAHEVARNLHLANDGLRGQPGFVDWMSPGGVPRRVGERFCQPALAATLRAIAQHGERGFYSGPTAERLVRFSRDHGGLFSESDFATAQADWVVPWLASASGHQVHVMPPNSVGVLMLQQLQRWEAAGAPKGESDIAPAIEAAVGLIAAGRNRLGDPGRIPLAPEDFALPHGQPDTHAFKAARAGVGDTTGFVAMDEAGNALAMLQSVFQPFGSGAFDNATGILLNNRMFDFSPTAGGVNSVGPGLRPSHTLNPWLMTKDGAVIVAGVSPGGVSQTTTGFQLATGALDGRLTLGQVVARPRWSLSRDGVVLLEPGMPSSIAAAVRASGLECEEDSLHEFYFGSAKVVRRSPDGGLEAAADTRRQATALGW